MRCADLDELISAYADGQTVPAQREFVEAHIHECSRCRAVLRRHQQTRRLLHLLNDNTWTPPDMRLRVAHAYRRRQQGAVWRPQLAAGVAASLAVLLFVAALAGGQGPWHAAAPVVLSSPSPAVAPLPAHRTLAQCGPHLPEYALARCLGVSRHMVPAILAEEVDFGQSSYIATSLPPAPWRPSSQSASRYSAEKGGGIRTVSTRHRSGLIPL